MLWYIISGAEGMYTASYPYNSAEPGDLVFQAGDVILVTEKNGDWWTGKLGDKYEFLKIPICFKKVLV